MLPNWFYVDNIYIGSSALTGNYGHYGESCPTACRPRNPLSITASGLPYAPRGADVTTYGLKYPAEMKRDLESVLPSRHAASLVVRVTPRDQGGRKCPAYAADCYEVQAYYTRTSPEALDLLEKAFQDQPGVYLTTQVRDDGSGRLRNEVTNPEWPARLGRSRPGLHELRAQVLALVRD
jgi:hypothetical protein